MEEKDPFYTNLGVYYEPPYYSLEVMDPYTFWPSTSGFDEDHILYEGEFHYEKIISIATCLSICNIILSNIF